MKKECILYKKLNSSTVQCTCCQNYCVLKKNEIGKCGVRQNINGKLFINVFGKAVSYNIDPIEKKPLYHFLPNTEIFSFGTVGCNFSCLFCQNWEISQTIKNTLLEENELGKDLKPEYIADICMQNFIKSIAYTYNEPTIFFEYAFETMKLAKSRGIKNIFVSNGFQSKEFWEIAKDYIDAINIDLKSFSDKFYSKICGGNLNGVLKNIEFIAKNTNIWLEITTLIIPGENDSKEELEKIAKFIASINKNIPWHISAFYPCYKMLKKQPTSGKKLIEAYEIGKVAGLNFIYIGNLDLPGYSDTYCPKCEEKLIKRIGYNVEIFYKKPGICHKCNEKLAGIWK
ncbi:MAG: AmmeMemoRadiSam system radical SAM enzyme [Candidatus Gracilibacteria bacterium]|nr:AmmeMemoRadiSam system radical SAM enzyme [Candidatus Gracilibacteria bacterium]MDD3120442.1 AmmeMemoRadiSam system radical SAM enzyme [Candidatus Gracilibacteria bacterium]MDD4530924.1 AmmeMemoRadiSam system radical SAM enzyme [Candidatus Gracilibacteria bacterium]